MSGNVWEWCYDWYAEYPIKTQIDPIGTNEEEFKVIRSSSFLLEEESANYCGEITTRNKTRPVDYSEYYGFRIVLDSIHKPECNPNSHNKINNPLNCLSFTETVNGVSYDMVFVKGGTFLMGKGEFSKDNKLPHDVTLSDYYIGQTEVTQELWGAIMGYNPSCYKSATHPVESVSWNEANEFCKRLSQLTGENYCLPTEAQWEFAAKGGTVNKSNNYLSVENGWFGGKGGVPYAFMGIITSTHPVAKQNANELGIYDMIGNVEEWCQDWYAPYQGNSQINPTGPIAGTYKMSRGVCVGSYVYIEDDPITARGFNYEQEYEFSYPHSKSKYRGFRIALNTTQKLHYTKTSVSERDGYEWVSLKGESNLCGAQVGGKVIVPAEYSEVKYMPYYNGYFLVGKDGYMGVYDCSGKYLIPIDRCYSSILKTCSDGRYYYRVCKDGKYGACEINGMKIIDPIYADLILFNGIFYYKDGENWVALEYGLNTDHECIIVDKEDVSQSALINYDIVLEQNKLEEAFGKDVVVEQVVTEDGNRAFKMIFENKILFDFGKSNLNAQAIRYIEQVAEALKNLPSTNVIIKGYTDNVGSLESNKRVSNNRAKAVSDRLALLGIARTRLSAQGVPLADYVATNETEEGRALNRRVEIVIEPTE